LHFLQPQRRQPPSKFSRLKPTHHFLTGSPSPFLRQLVERALRRSLPCVLRLPMSRMSNSLRLRKVLNNPRNEHVVDWPNIHKNFNASAGILLAGRSLFRAEDRSNAHLRLVGHLIIRLCGWWCPTSFDRTTEHRNDSGANAVSSLAPDVTQQPRETTILRDLPSDPPLHTQGKDTTAFRDGPDGL